MNTLTPVIAANFASISYEIGKGRKEKTDF